MMIPDPPGPPPSRVSAVCVWLRLVGRTLRFKFIHPPAAHNAENFVPRDGGGGRALCV